MRRKSIVWTIASAVVLAVISLLFFPYFYFRWYLPFSVNASLTKSDELSIFKISRVYKSVALDGVEVNWFYRDGSPTTEPIARCKSVNLILHRNASLYETAPACLVDRTIKCSSDGSGSLYAMYRIRASRAPVVTYEVSRETKEMCARR